MIAEILAHAGQIQGRATGANARTQQNRRRSDCTGAKDDPLFCLQPAAVTQDHSLRASVLEINAVHLDTSFNSQPRARAT